MTEGAVTDRTDEVLERMAKRTAELDGMSPEEREAYFARLDQEEIQKRRLDHAKELEDRIVPKAFRHDIELPRDIESTISGWFEKFWTEDERDDEWTKQGRTGLCFVGRPGAGKSHAAWMIVRSLLARGWSQLEWRSCSELFDELKDCAQNKRSDKELLDRICKVDLLVLDDLGAKQLTEFREEKLLQILNARSENHMSTIVTTNIAAPQMSQFFGARNASRIGGMCELVVFPDFDHRTGVDYSKTKRGPSK